MPKRRKTKNQILASLLAGKDNKKYQGKQVIVFDSRVYVLPEDEKESAKLVNKLMDKDPKKTPTIVSVPRPETYILNINLNL